MESNEQTELTRKTDRLVDGEQMTATGVGKLGGGGNEQKGKRTHRHGQQCGNCRGQGSIRELNGNGKKYNKHKSTK